MAAGAAKWVALRWPSMGGRYCRLLLLAIAWTIAEWLRGHVFTGYAWNPLAHVWAFATPLLQGAALFGVYGLGLLTFMILAAPAAGWRASILALVVAGGAGFAGQAAMAPVDTAGEGPLVRIVQPNTPQAEKWRPEMRAAHMAKLVEMSRRHGFDGLAAVIWPETAPPFVVQPGSAALEVMAKAVPPGGYLLTGAARRRAIAKTGSGTRCWSSMAPARSSPPTTRSISSPGRVHPLPQATRAGFGRHRTRLVRGGGIARHTRSAAPAVLLADHLLRGDLPGRRHRSRGPPALAPERDQRCLVRPFQWPYQHLASARLRAVEEGLPMLRAANTGVSAVIDAYGRVLAALDMQRKASSTIGFPPRANRLPMAGGAMGRWLCCCLSQPDAHGRSTLHTK